MIVGVGALGSVSAELLCRAGIGRLTLVDFDIVQESNLQRQSLYTELDIGRLKIDAAKEHLLAIDRNCVIHCIAEPYTAETSLEGIDLILDGTDTLATRLLINDAAKKLNIPLIIAAASETKGFVFTVSGSPCWQCITVAKKATDDCDSGVLGMATHAIASLQAAAALKVLLGRPDRELFELDIWANSFRSIAVQQNPACKACRGVYDYLQEPFKLRFCSARSRLQAQPSKPKILDMEKVRHLGTVEREYDVALVLSFGSGRVLVHKWGLLEFEDVDEQQAKDFARKILEN
jgi:molybdopterin-synthase adenylyltransferase